MPRLSRPLVFLAALLLLGCTEEKIVFRDPNTFNPPADAQSGFLGYFTVSNKRTTCGGCHIAHQRDWAPTRHADAYATLANLGSQAQPFCFSCHTVTEKGNSATGTVGHDAVQDTSYRDVQCESCHGPGLEHVEEPDAEGGQVPRAHVGVADTGASCASCHSGAHHPFVDEWEQSGHAEVLAAPAGRAECQSCHTGQGALRAWNVNANYVERDDPTQLPVTCAVCHDPHGSANGKQLRYAIDNPDPEQNLCMRCHIRRTEPVGGSAQGARPHAPQGAVLMGSAGFRPSGFTYDTSRAFTSHASERNPRLCAGCHVLGYEITDSLTGAFQVATTGHLFKATPCLGAQGQPIADTSCARTVQARSWRSCTNSGCHASPEAAASAFANNVARLQALSDQLWVDADNDETIDPTGDTGYLPQIKAGRPAEFTADATITAAEGAEFNARMVGIGLYGNGDNSYGVHNPFLSEALLRASVQELQRTYALTAPSAAVRRILEEPMKQPSVAPLRSGVKSSTMPPARVSVRPASLRTASR